jgi:hypothetical protein
MNVYSKECKSILQFWIHIISKCIFCSMEFHSDLDVTCCEHNPISNSYYTILGRLHYIYYLEYTAVKPNEQ